MLMTLMMSSKINEDDSITHFIDEYEKDYLNALKEVLKKDNLYNYIVSIIINNDDKKKMLGSLYIVSNLNSKNEEELEQFSRYVNNVIYTSFRKIKDFDDEDNMSFIISLVNAQNDYNPFLDEKEFIEITFNKYIELDTSKTKH